MSDTDHSDADRLFGELAVRLYLTTRRDLSRALKAQREARDAGGSPAIGEVMVGLDMLSEDQVSAVLEAQQVYDDTTVETLYGKLAVKNGFITQTDLEAALKIQQRTGRRLRVGEVLVKKSYMTWEQHEAILAAQERILAGLARKRQQAEEGGAPAADEAEPPADAPAAGKVTLRPPGS